MDSASLRHGYAVDTPHHHQAFRAHLSKAHLRPVEHDLSLMGRKADFFRGKFHNVPIIFDQRPAVPFQGGPGRTGDFLQPGQRGNVPKPAGAKTAFFQAYHQPIAYAGGERCISPKQNAVIVYKSDISR